MKTSQKQVIGIPTRTASYAVEKMPRLLLENAEQRYIPTPANKALACKQSISFFSSFPLFLNHK
jgi:hypothetical protein